MKDPNVITSRLTWGEILFALTVVWLLAALSGLGCAQPAEGLGISAVADGAQSRGLWIAPGVPQEPVLAACAEWADTGLTCELAPSRAEAFITVDVDPGACGPERLGWGNVREVHLRTACWPFWMDRQYFQMVAATAHEFGHALGLGHVEDDTALMFQVANGATGINAADRMEFLRVWGTGGPP